MKRILFAALFVIAGYFSYGQCGTKVVFTSSKTQHLGADSSVQGSEDETTIVEFDKSTITITPNGNAMTGKIKSYTCEWATPYKVGHTVLKAEIVNQNGETKQVTITIDGKDGKIVFLGSVDDEPEHKIRMYADKFEEKH